MATITELVTKFSFKGSTAPLAAFNSKLGKSILILGGFASATIATSALLARWTNSLLSSIDPLIRISKQTGVATQFIQEMGYAATQSGGSIQAVEKTILSLSRKIGSAVLRGNEDFSRLGISVRKTNGEVKKADEILLEIAKRFKEMKLDLATRVTIAESLGIDSTLVEMLGKTGKKIKELRDESKGFGILTKAQTEQIDSYNRSVQRLRFNFDGIKRLIAVGLSPELEKLAESFDKLLLRNQDLIVKGIGKFAEAMGEVMDLIVRMSPLIAALGLAFIAFKITAVGVVAALGGPVTLITAAVVALIALIDDLSMPLRGGESVMIDAPIKHHMQQGAALDSLFGSIGRFFGSGKVEQNVIIDVKSTDPKRAAEEIANSLGEQLEDAKTQLQVGGM